MRRVRALAAGLGRPPNVGADAGSDSGTALAAIGYTAVAAAQKASGFILLIAFTRVLSPSEYGQVALLTTVGTLLLMVLSLGLEPRIIYAYFRVGDDLPNYLHVARRVSIGIPVMAAILMTIVLAAAPVPLRSAWIMECAGISLMAAGTTYAYAVLRAARRVRPYMVLALIILVTQVAARIVAVAVLDAGPTGWAASDLLAGVVAFVVGYVIARRAADTSATGPFTWWGVLRDGLPLVPHYLAHWGLSLSDRLVLALFVTTAAVGVYSALYQFAAVISLILSEVNRAFMPTYARCEPGAPELQPLVRRHLDVTFALYAALMLGGFAAIEIVLPAAYRDHDELFPVLALGALAFGLYYVPMNGLTLVAGITSRSPAISGIALAVNLALNFTLDPVLGLWGAAIATAAGYAALALAALGFEIRSRGIPWRLVARGHARSIVLHAGVVTTTAAAIAPGPLRAAALVALGLLGCAIVLQLVGRSRQPIPG